jgi:hypothetical protein
VPGGGVYDADNSPFVAGYQNFVNQRQGGESWFGTVGSGHPPKTSDSHSFDRLQLRSINAPFHALDRGLVFESIQDHPILIPPD